MNVAMPTLRYHAKSGQWFCQWGYKRRYLGKDRKRARQRLIDEEIPAWRAWQATRESGGRSQQPLTVADLVDRFLEAKAAEGGKRLAAGYRTALKRFNGMLGPAVAADIRARHVAELRAAMLDTGYARKTVNHDLTTVRMMLGWAAEMDLIPPVRLKGVRNLPLDPPPDRSLSRDAVLAMIDAAPDHVACWLCAQYLMLARPCEIVRLVNGQAREIADGIYRLDYSKVGLKTGQPRHLVCSDEALGWLEQCEPHWTRSDSYSRAVRRACGPGGPHPLRHSAATHLAALGIARADVDLLLGHTPPRISQIYSAVTWSPLRPAVSRLTLRSDP